MTLTLSKIFKVCLQGVKMMVEQFYYSGESIKALYEMIDRLKWTIKNP